MLLFVTLHKDTNTGVEDLKGTRGTHTLLSAITCLSAYPPVRHRTHLTAMLRRFPRPLLTPGKTSLLDEETRATLTDTGSSKLSTHRQHRKDLNKEVTVQLLLRREPGHDAFTSD